MPEKHYGAADCSRDLRLFGRDLRRWLNSEEGGYSVLPGDYETWIAGGCWILAEALQAWIGPGAVKWSIHSQEVPGRIQHVVVKVGHCFLDGDGASSEEMLLRRWRDKERIERPFLKEFRIEETGRGSSRIECPARAVRSLTEHLRAVFGDGHHVLEWARGR